MLYKDYRAVVERAATEWFKRHGRRVGSRKPYILGQHDDWPENLIDPEILRIVEGVRPRHTFVHHGLSSQALCFNLFGSLMKRDDLPAVARVFRAAGAPWPDGPCAGGFEFVRPSVFGEEHREQPTSWDFAIWPKDAPREPFVLIEVKFVEQSVGACSVFTRGDCDGANPKNDFALCYLHREKRRTYWDVFRAQGLLNTAPFAGAICPMTIYYQFYREAAFAAATGAHMVYLFDDRNPVFLQQEETPERGLLPHLVGHLPQALRSRVSTVTLGDVVRDLINNERHVSWATEFAAKYGFAS